ncbi:MAG: LamG-like jellyroll fold domain-containing protein [Bacteroidota bacterium]
MKVYTLLICSLLGLALLSGGKLEAQANVALDFTSSSDGIQIQRPFDATGDFTFEVWIFSNNTSSASGDIARIALFGGPDDRLDIGDLQGELQLFESFPGGFQNSGVNIRDGQWHHVAFSRSGNTYDLYVDGVLRISRDYLFETPDIIPVGYFNGSNDDNSQWVGLMDEIRIWNFARSADEILAQYECPLDEIDQAGLVGYYTFNEGIPSGDNTALTTLVDSSPNGNDADLLNFTLEGETSNFVLADDLFVECPSSCGTEECPSTNILNISTGIDSAGNLISVGQLDPYWELINVPPLTGGGSPDIMVPDVYAVDPSTVFASWNVITDPAYPMSQPVNIRNGTNLPNNNLNSQQPFRIRREICVCETSTVCIDAVTRADNAGRLLLYSEVNPTIPLADLGGTTTDGSTSAFNQDWPIKDTLTLLPGTYHLEYELRNLSGVASGFSLAGTIDVLSGDMTLFNSESSCCGGGVISLQKILDEDCDGERDNGEPGLANFDFTLTNVATSQTITATTDAFGEIIFRALPYGTYTLTETVSFPWVPTNPTSGSTTITIDADNPIVATTFLNKNTEECNCAQSGLTLENSSEDECCFDLSLTNQNLDVFYVEIEITQGALIDDLTANVGPGLTVWGSSPTSRLIGSSTPGPLPANIPDLIEFCLTEVIAAPQIIDIRYLNADLEEVCVDMLAASCPVSNPCLDLVQADLDCHPEGYELTLDLINPPGGDFDSVGFVQVHVTSPQSQVQLFEYTYDPALSEGSTITLNEILPSNFDLFGEDLCIVVTAHDDPEQRICCFVDSLCIPFPLCDPCPFVDVDVVTNPEDSCCYTLTVDNFVPVAGYFDSIYVEVTSGPNPTLLSSNPISSSAWNGSVVTPDQSFSYVPAGGATTPLFDLPILDFCVTPAFSMDSTVLTVSFFNTEEDTVCVDSVTAICMLDDPCPELETFLVQSEEDSCCYDVVFANSFTADPTLLQGVRVQWIDGPGSGGFESYTALPIPGWNPPIIQTPGFDYLFTHASGALPVTAGTTLMEFCVEATFSTDSTFVETSILTEVDTICNDTLSAFCPGCLTIDSDDFACTDDGNYIYLFDFTNNSDFPVNRVVLLQSDGQTGLNEESIIDLGVTVPVGGSFSTGIPVDLSGDPGDEVCFDIVLRFVVPEQQINIECCFVTHCVVLPDCEDVFQLPCPFDDFIWAVPCPTDDIQPVCGCDGITYANPCLALFNQILDWTVGPCQGNGNRLVVTAHPNPVLTELTIVSNRPEPAQLSLIDLSGRQSLNERVDFSSGKVRLDVSRQTPGVYTVMVRYDDGVQGVLRFVKE